MNISGASRAAAPVPAPATTAPRGKDADGDNDGSSRPAVAPAKPAQSVPIVANGKVDTYA